MRNNFAHNIWGYTTDLDDALLLVHQKFILHYWGRASDWMHQLIHDPINLAEQSKINNEDVEVWRTKDFNQEVENMNAAATWTEALHQMVVNDYYIVPEGAKRDRAYEYLYAQPAIRTKVDKALTSPEPLL